MDPKADLLELLRILEEQDLPHMVVGAHAMAAFGFARTTADVDLQIGVPAERPGSTFLGWIVEERARDVVFDQEAIIVHRPTSGVPFELFVTTHWFTKQALERRMRGRVEALGLTVPIPSIEDFILMKACHMVHPSRRRSKSAQDAVDIESVAAVVAPFDLPYLKENGTKLGCWEALEPLLGDR